MKVGEKELKLLSELIVSHLQQEFADKHLSKNLINTIVVENLGDEINIRIPAQMYNMLIYQHKGVIVHTTNGSYASKLDEEGSTFYIYPKDTRKGAFRIYPRNHIGYVDRVINGAIQEWKGLVKGMKVNKVEG